MDLGTHAPTALLRTSLRATVQRTRTVLTLPRTDKDYPARQLAYLALMLVPLIAGCVLVLDTYSFAWTWLLPFFVLAVRADYAMSFRFQDGLTSHAAEEPIILAAAILLAPAQAAVLVLTLMVLTVFMDSRSRAHMLICAGNALCPAATVLLVGVFRHWVPVDSGGTILAALLVGWLGIQFGVVLIFGHIAIIERPAALWAFVRERMLAADVLAGNVGQLSAAAAAVMASSMSAWAVATIMVPYLVVFRAAKVAEDLAVAEAKIGNDALTGLANRERLAAHLDAEVAAAGRYGHQVALVMGDLDNFKRVNDTLGHIAGDEVLQRAAAILKGIAGDDPRLLPARYGGEEFVLVTSTVHRPELLQLAERLRSEVHEDLNEQFGTSISIGCAYWRSGQTVLEWIDQADKALYDAKLAGKDRVHEWCDDANAARPAHQLRAA